MDAAQVLADLSRGLGAHGAVGDGHLAVSRAGARGRVNRSCSRARRARCSTSITAPIRTSPRRTPRSAASAPGSAIPPRAIDGVLGVAKAYTTRVGEGPLPTELTGEIGDRLRETGQEFGAVTGRPRRCGWYDAVAVRYAVRVNGLDALALTKLDVLDGMQELQICTSYRSGGDDVDASSRASSRNWPRASRSTSRCRGGRRQPKACGGLPTCRRMPSAISGGSRN